MLNPDYQDILSAFEEEGVKYLLVGAYALAVHGHVRATGDIDLWVATSEDNAARIMAALRRFGAPLHQIEERDFETLRTVFQIGVAPRRIDILTNIDAVDFDAAGDQPPSPAAEQASHRASTGPGRRTAARRRRVAPSRR